MASADEIYITIKGKSGHGAMPHQTVDPILTAAELVMSLQKVISRTINPFEPGVLTIGKIEGGTAVNILARQCTFAFDLRCPPGLEPQQLIEPFLAEARALDVQLKARFPDAGVQVARRSGAPALAPEAEGEAERLVRRIAGDNGPARAVPYAAEAGLFQLAGFSSVICGPGSIEQAHQPDEYIEISQIERGATFMLRLADALAD